MHSVESRYAWWRLVASTAISTLGGVGMCSISVVMPAVQAEFAATRADVSLSYTTTMLGFGLGSVLAGRLIDLRGAFFTVTVAALVLVIGYVAAAFATGLLAFALIQGILIGIGAAASFVPMMADISHWFDRRRGLAMAICGAGNYLAGALWPKLIDVVMRQYDWRTRPSAFDAGAWLAAALADEHEQAATSVEVVAVLAQMVGQCADAIREERHLHFGRTGITGCALVGGNDLGFLCRAD